MRFIKMYHVRQDDFDDEGNVKPGAELMPAFAENYGYVPGTMAEQHGKPLEYDNSTNKHPGRHANIYELDFDYDGPSNSPEASVLRKTNHEAVNRGASVLARTRGREKTDDIFYDWNTRDHNMTKDDFARLREQYIRKGGKGKYQLHSIKHAGSSGLYSNFSRNILDTDDDRILCDFLSSGANLGKVDGVKTARVPFIVEGDEDDIISLDDVLNRGYDPLRDFMQEAQLKNIRVRSLPNGIIVPDNSVMSKDFTDLLNIGHGLAYDADGFVHTIRNFLLDARNIARLDTTDEEEWENVGDLMLSVKDKLSELDKFLRSNSSDIALMCEKADSKDLVDKGLLATMENVLQHGLLGLSSFAEGNEPDGSQYNYIDIVSEKTGLPEKDVEKAAEYCNKHVANLCKDVLSFFDSIRKSNAFSKNNNTFYNSNGKLLRYNNIDWRKWLSENFNENDPMNYSDKHLKTVIRDLSKGIRDKRNTQAAVNVVRRRML